MAPEKQKKPNWLAIGWEFAFMNARPCIIIAEHRLGKSNILLSSYENEGVIELKGYRKASDVAREIFEEIQRRFKEFYLEGKMTPFQCCVKAIDETEKKYTEDEK